MQSLTSTSSRQNLLIEALQLSRNAYKTFGSRSPKKLTPIHGEIARAFIANGKDARAKGVGDGKEFYVPTDFGEPGEGKNCDITLLDPTGTPVTVVEVKAPMTNIIQNASGAFYNNIGETQVLQASGYKVAHMIILPTRNPYLNRLEKIERIEKVSNKTITRYRKFMNHEKMSSPDSLFIGIFDIFGTLVKGQDFKNLELTHTITQDTDYSRFSEDNQIFLQNVSNYDNFISQVSAL